MKHIQGYKYLSFLAMLYVTIALTTVVLIYKVTTLHHFTVSASSFIIPIWFLLADIIAEVYGYQVLRKIIWATLMCEFIFVALITALIHLPANVSDANTAAYIVLFNGLYRVFLGSIVAVVLGSFLNGYILVRWKALTRGRYFWIRSVCSSAIGEGLFTALAFTIEFFGKVPMLEMMELIIISYMVKVIFLPIAATPALFVANILKIKENLIDDTQNINPLKTIYPEMEVPNAKS